MPHRTLHASKSTGSVARDAAHPFDRIRGFTRYDHTDWPLAVHLFLPAIPVVKHELGVSDAMAQLTFSAALIAMAFSTLIYGSLADNLGRRPALLSGLALFLIGSVLSATAGDIWMLVAGRVVQAAGAGCSLTLVRTIARDVYGQRHLIKAIAYLTMFYTMGPIFAPVVGGVLIDVYGWRLLFTLQSWPAGQFLPQRC